MNILITAGNTQTPIDTVRCITNIFTGRTGASIAAEAKNRNHTVTLLTSHPETAPPSITVKPYRTYEDLAQLMAEEVPGNKYQAIIHCAAISDYQVKQILAPVATFSESANAFVTPGPHFIDASAGKVKSHHAEVWLRMVPTAKLVDRIRKDWQFRGTLVKFKLEVGITDAELLTIAEKSRVQSGADIMVANTYEGRKDWAYVGTGPGHYERIPRQELAKQVLTLIEG